jgi:hypothetical protein
VARSKSEKISTKQKLKNKKIIGTLVAILTEKTPGESSPDKNGSLFSSAIKSPV